jgi:hypothetical protein
MTTIVLIVLVGDALLLFFILRQAIITTMSIKSENAAIGMFMGLVVIVVVAELIIAFAFWRVFLHQLPLLPLLTRAMLVITFYKIRWHPLLEIAKEREQYRTVVLGLMAITFAGLTALSIVDARSSVFEIYPFYYMLLSFLNLYVTLTIQSYKDFEWQEQLGAGCLDAAILSLFLSLIAIFASSNQVKGYKYAFAALALGAWSIDHAARLRKEFRVAWGEYLRSSKTKILAINGGGL